MVKKLKINDESDLIIEGYVREIINNFGRKNINWKNNNLFQVLKNKKEIGTITLKDREIRAEGEAVVKALTPLIDFRKKMEKEKITTAIASKTVFKSVLSGDHSHALNGVVENPFLFHKINKLLKEVGIDEVTTNTTLSRTSSIDKKVRLAMNWTLSDSIYQSIEDGFTRRLKTLLFDHFNKTDFETADSFSPVSGNGRMSLFQNEKVIKIELPLQGNNKALIGYYHKERNLIILYFNPFMVKSALPFDKKVPEAVLEFIKLLGTLKIKRNSVDGLEKKMFISAFLDGQKKKLKELEKKFLELTKNIGNLENSIRKGINDMEVTRMTKGFIENNLEKGGKVMFREIDETKKLSFIKKVELGADSIKLTFIPATITIPSFTRIDNGKKYGKRVLYLGEITFDISPNNFKVNCDFPRGDNSHPHAGSGGVPCFGSGEGRNKIYEMLAISKFSEMAKLLWFWIKIYRNGGAHVKWWDYYDNRLRLGLPVWDDKGKRIEINEPARIKTDEQKSLTNASMYNTNIKKFKNMKMF